MKYKAFTLAEVVIAAIFIGIIAALTIPSSYESLKYKEHIKAYREAFEKVNEAISDFNDTNTNEVNADEGIAQQIWQMLDSRVPTIGYALANNNDRGSLTTPIADKINTQSGNLYSFARWTGGGSSTTIPTQVGSTTSNTVTQNNGFSPWIILENGMAFTLITDTSTDKGLVNLGNHGCHISQQFFNLRGILSNKNIGLDRNAVIASCVAIVVDVNGLDRGPNSLGSSNAISNQQEAYREIVDHDRFRIFITKGGNRQRDGIDMPQADVVPGPQGLLETYMKREQAH